MDTGIATKTALTTDRIPSLAVAHAVTNTTTAYEDRDSRAGEHMSRSLGTMSSASSWSGFVDQVRQVGATEPLGLSGKGPYAHFPHQ